MMSVSCCRIFINAVHNLCLLGRIWIQFEANNRTEIIIDFSGKIPENLRGQRALLSVTERIYSSNKRSFRIFCIFLVYTHFIFFVSKFLWSVYFNIINVYNIMYTLNIIIIIVIVIIIIFNNISNITTLSWPWPLIGAIKI